MECLNSANTPECLEVLRPQKKRRLVVLTDASGVALDSRNQVEEKEGTKLIPLTRGYFARVDEEDYERISKYRWHVAARTNSALYAVRTLKKVRADGDRIIVRMHNLVLQNMNDVDHRDGSGLNNTKSNLRPCTNSQNQANTVLGEQNTSGYKGVYENNGWWQARIRMRSQRQTYIGCFKTPEEAARAYDAEAIKQFGEFARLNFPTPSHPLPARIRKDESTFHIISEATIMKNL